MPGGQAVANFIQQLLAQFLAAERRIDRQRHEFACFSFPHIAQNITDCGRVGLLRGGGRVEGKKKEGFFAFKAYVQIGALHILGSAHGGVELLRKATPLAMISAIGRIFSSSSRRAGRMTPIINRDIGGIVSL